jgi:hypothetical protein
MSLSLGQMWRDFSMYACLPSPLYSRPDVASGAAAISGLAVHGKHLRNVVSRPCAPVEHHAPAAMIGVKFKVPAHGVCCAHSEKMTIVMGGSFAAATCSTALLSRSTKALLTKSPHLARAHPLAIPRPSLVAPR